MEKAKKKIIKVRITTMPTIDMEENLKYGCGFTGDGMKDNQYYNTSLICFGHSNYSDVNKHSDWVDVERGYSFEDHISRLERANPKFIITPIWLYRHSSECLEWSPSCRWDSGPLGCIAVRRRRGARVEGYETATEKAFNLLNEYWFSTVYELEDAHGGWIGPLTYSDIEEVVKDEFGDDAEYEIVYHEWTLSA